MGEPYRHPDQGRGIGIGAPGLDKPLPTPDAATILHVMTEQIFRDGSKLASESTTRWDGYTVADAIANRTTRWRDAKRPFERDGDVLTTTTDRGDYVERQQLSFTDAPAIPGEGETR